MIGEIFLHGDTRYQITRIEEIGEDMPNMRERLIANGKEPRAYFAGKVLKNETVSEKQGGMFYRFNRGEFVKVL